MVTFLKMCTFNFVLCFEVIVKCDVLDYSFFSRRFAFIDGSDSRRKLKREEGALPGFKLSL